MMGTRKSKLVTLTDAELEKATGGFVWKGVEYNTMADVRNALAQGSITEEGCHHYRQQPRRTAQLKTRHPSVFVTND